MWLKLNAKHPSKYKIYVIYVYSGFKQFFLPDLEFLASAVAMYSSEQLGTEMLIITEVFQIRKCWILCIDYLLDLDITNIFVVFQKIGGVRYNEPSI